MLALAIGAKAQSRYAEHSLLSKGKWVKIKTTKEGVYQLTKSALSSMGFKDPDKVKLYGYNLPMLPEAYIENIPDDLTEIPLYRKENGTMLFYSCGTVKWTNVFSANTPSSFNHMANPYSNYIAYFLTESTDGEPLKMDVKKVEQYMSTFKTFPDHALLDYNDFSFMKSGRTYFEAYDFANGPSRTYTVPLPDIASTEVNLKLQFGTSGRNSSALSVSSDGTTLTTVNFVANPDNENGVVNKAVCTWSNVVSEKPQLKLTHTRPSGINGHLDYIQADYIRSLTISGDNFLRFTSPSYSAAEIEGANNATKVWNVTSTNAMEMYEGKLEGSTYKVPLPSTVSNKDQYVAVKTDASFPEPEVVGAIENQDLHAVEEADLVIVTPANGLLTEQAKRLADAHTSIDKMKCVVVEADKLYNEFSSGTPDATAYRRFMKMLYDRSGGNGPRNILLFGNCVWDNRLVTSQMKNKKQDDYLLCYESVNSVSSIESYVLEEYFALLADKKGVSPLKEKLDCGVGRLPLGTAAEAKEVVDKIIRYMSNADVGSWKNTICVLADDGNNNVHMDDAEAVITTIQSANPYARVKRIYWDSYKVESSSTGLSYGAAYNDINKVMEEGALVMNYTGHGAAYCLSHEKVLKTKDFQEWASPRLPLWFTAGCDIAPIDMNEENLACEAVLNPKGAAIAFIGTARTVYSSPNRTINRNFMNRVLTKKPNGDRFTIGEALSQAKTDILSSKTRYTKNDTINKVQYVLVGDPALKLTVPDYHVVLDKINEMEANSNTMPTISAGELVTIQGHIVDEKGNEVKDFKGIVSPFVLDSEQLITCYNNEKDNVTPKKYYDRIRTLYSGVDSVADGKFSITFPVPLDINYSNKKGLMHLYAISTDKTLEASGRYNSFLIGGTSDDDIDDKEGPEMTVRMNTLSAGNNATGDAPVLFLNVKDKSGINTTGNGFGHDFVAIIDNNENTTYNLNSYYQQSVGDYRSGTVSFQFPKLAAGKHSMVIRVFDTLNNMTEQTYSFEVIDGLTEVCEIFDMAGRKMLNADHGKSLPKGVYVRRIRLVSPLGVFNEKTEKFIVTQ